MLEEKRDCDVGSEETQEPEGRRPEAENACRGAGAAAWIESKSEPQLAHDSSTNNLIRYYWKYRKAI